MCLASKCENYRHYPISFWHWKQFSEAMTWMTSYIYVLVNEADFLLMILKNLIYLFYFLVIQTHEYIDSQRTVQFCWSSFLDCILFAWSSWKDTSGGQCQLLLSEHFFGYSAWMYLQVKWNNYWNSLSF